MAKCKRCGKKLSFWNKAIGAKNICKACWGKTHKFKDIFKLKKSEKKKLEKIPPLGILKVLKKKTFPGTIDSIYKSSILVLHKLNWKIKSQSKKQIICTTKISLMAFGEDVAIMFKKVSGGIEVSITSRAKGGVLASVGGNLKSRRNISKFFSELSSALMK